MGQSRLGRNDDADAAISSASTGWWTRPSNLDGCRFWGSPWSVPFFKWAFMRPEKELAETWAQIPDDTDVVIVHGPPKGYGDRTNSDGA